MLQMLKNDVSLQMLEAPGQLLHLYFCSLLHADCEAPFSLASPSWSWPASLNFVPTFVYIHIYE